MSLPYDHEAVWMKAKVFINRSFDALDNDFPLAALWAANSLELLAKSALCKINPLLVADPSDDGRSLLLAAGLPGDKARYKSIPAKALYKRCANAFKSFSERNATEIALERNAELHSGANPFSGVSDEQLWWEKFWSTAAVLIDEQNCTIEEFVGSSHVAMVQHLLERNAQNVKERVNFLIERAKHRLANGEAPPKWPKLERYLTISIACPVCQGNALLGGDHIQDSDIVIGEDESGLDHTYELFHVWSDFFQCEECGLMIEGEAHIEAADLDPIFKVGRLYEPDLDDLYDYGND